MKHASDLRVHQAHINWLSLGVSVITPSFRIKWIHVLCRKAIEQEDSVNSNSNGCVDVCGSFTCVARSWGDIAVFWAHNVADVIVQAWLLSERVVDFSGRINVELDLEIDTQTFRTVPWRRVAVVRQAIRLHSDIDISTDFATCDTQSPIPSTYSSRSGSVIYAIAYSWARVRLCRDIIDTTIGSNGGSLWAGIPELLSEFLALRKRSSKGSRMYSE